MKKLLINAMLLVASISAYSQKKVTYKEVQKEDLVYILNNLEKVTSYNNNNDLFITVYSVSDLSGSAGLESCAVTNRYYIAVSEDGEAPEQHLYKLGSVYEPQFIRWIKSPREPKLVFTYIDLKANIKRIVTAAITLNKIVVNTR
jgi:hypothetical protein